MPAPLSDCRCHSWHCRSRRPAPVRPPSAGSCRHCRDPVADAARRSCRLRGSMRKVPAAGASDKWHKHPVNVPSERVPPPDCPRAVHNAHRPTLSASHLPASVPIRPPSRTAGSEPHHFSLRPTPAGSPPAQTAPPWCVLFGNVPVFDIVLWRHCRVPRFSTVFPCALSPSFARACFVSVSVQMRNRLYGNAVFPL